MVIAGKEYPRQAAVEEVATATLRCMRLLVPAAVPGIVLLSGGQNARLATAHLNAINRLLGSKPWNEYQRVRWRPWGCAHWPRQVRRERLRRQKSALFQWLAVPLWFPTDKIACQQIRGIPFECFSTRRPASSPALGGLIHKLTNTL
jgi:Fructose-bisphosphate aldolase class-I